MSFVLAMIVLPMEIGFGSLLTLFLLRLVFSGFSSTHQHTVYMVAVSSTRKALNNIEALLIGYILRHRNGAVEIPSTCSC